MDLIEKLKAALTNGALVPEIKKDVDDVKALVAEVVTVVGDIEALVLKIKALTPA